MNRLHSWGYDLECEPGKHIFRWANMTPEDEPWENDLKCRCGLWKWEDYRRYLKYGILDLDDQPYLGAKTIRQYEEED